MWYAKSIKTTSKTQLAPTLRNSGASLTRVLRSDDDYDDYDDEDGEYDDGDRNGEYWLKDGEAEYADGNYGDQNHEMIAENEIYNRLGYDLEDGQDYSPNDTTARDFFQPLAMGKHSTQSPYWEDFKIWARQQHGSDDWPDFYSHVDYIKWLHDRGLPEDQRMRPEDVDRELAGLSNPRKHAMQNYGWARLQDQNITLWDLTPKSLQNLASGLYNAYGNRAAKQTYTIEIGSTGKALQDVTLDDIASGNIVKRLREPEMPFNVKPRDTMDAPYLNNNPVGNKLYRYPGARVWYPSHRKRQANA